MPSKEFKIGFIGAGGIARTQMHHLKKVEGAQVVAAADVAPAMIELARKEHEVPNLYADYKEMLRKHPELDAVSVCTPNGLHAQNTIDALDAGKHVLVEKPMAMNAREGQAMVDAAKRANKTLIVGFQHRFEPRSKVIRDQVASGQFGRVLYVRAQALRRRGIPSWGVFGQKDKQGGGPMIDIGVHILETAHSLIGAPRPVAASGATFTYLGDKAPAAEAPWGPWDWKTYTVEDLAVALIRFDNNAVLTIESSFAAHIEKDIWNVTILGEKCGASWEGPDIFTDLSGYMVNVKPQHIGKWDNFEYKMRHFVEVCRDGRANECPMEHGLMVQKMLDAVYASAEKGREVAIE
jgi:predicted dehydrogenase